MSNMKERRTYLLVSNLHAAIFDNVYHVYTTTPEGLREPHELYPLGLAVCSTSPHGDDEPTPILIYEANHQNWVRPSNEYYLSETRGRAVNDKLVALDGSGRDRTLEYKVSLRDDKIFLEIKNDGELAEETEIGDVKNISSREFALDRFYVESIIDASNKPVVLLAVWCAAKARHAYEALAELNKKQLRETQPNRNN